MQLAIFKHTMREKHSWKNKVIILPFISIEQVAAKVSKGQNWSEDMLFHI